MLSSTVQALAQSLSPGSIPGSSGSGTATAAMPATTSLAQHATPRWMRPSTAKEIVFTGPTTSAFGFDLAKSSLQQRGIDEEPDNDDHGDTQEPSPMSSPCLNPSRDGDPLWTVDGIEAARLCRVYEEEMGIMYPVLDLDVLLRQVHALYTGAGSTLADDDVHILRLVFACALTAEASGGSELAVRLFESVRTVADNYVWGVPEIKRIIFLALVVSAFFPCLAVLLLRMCQRLRNSLYSTFKWTRKPSPGALLASSNACASKSALIDAKV